MSATLPFAPARLTKTADGGNSEWNQQPMMFDGQQLRTQQCSWWIGGCKHQHRQQEAEQQPECISGLTMQSAKKQNHCQSSLCASGIAFLPACLRGIAARGVARCHRTLAKKWLLEGADLFIVLPFNTCIGASIAVSCLFCVS